MPEILAIGPGPESVAILLYAAPATAGRWDTTKWDGGNWYAAGWQSVGCDVGEAELRWGASQESGILSVAEAGELDLRTIDPERELDPLNTSSPYYGAVRPGTALRLVGYAPAATPVATAYIDEVTYDVASARGRIRAVDAIAYLSQAQVPAGTSLPNTLRARVRAIVAAVGLGPIVPVEPEPAATVELVVNGSFANGMSSWPVYSGPPGSAGSGDPTVGTYGRWQGNGTTTDVQAYQSVPVREGQTYTITAKLFGTGWGDRPAVVQADARDLNGAAVTFNVIALSQVAAAWVTLTGSYTVPVGLGIGWLSIRVGITGGAVLVTSSQVASVSAVSCVGPNPVTAEPDPPVAAYDSSQARPAWQVISDAAQDALTYVWLDPSGMLRFRSWGALVDAPINVGCPPADADPGDQWLEGLSTIETTASGDAVRNSVRAYTTLARLGGPEPGGPEIEPLPVEPDAEPRAPGIEPLPAGPGREPRAGEPRTAVWSAAITDAVSVAKYGPRPFDVPRVLPDLPTFASRVLADRSDAGLELGIGEIRPYTQAELAALLATGQLGPSVIRVRDDAHGELIDLDLAMIGAHIGITPAGWRFALVTFLSRVSWDAITPEPPIPPIPPAGTWHVETRQYVASSDALLALTSGGAKYGAGASSSLPVGAWSGWTYRSVLAFPAIPWTKIRALRTATLKVQSSTQVRVGFGSSPKTQLLRITSNWSAGSASSPSSGNAVVWPGPNTTSSGAVTSSLPTGQNAAKSIDVSAIVRAWAPSAVGGSGAAQYGIELREASGSTSNTGEIWPVERGGAARPMLELVLEVFD